MRQALLLLAVSVGLVAGCVNAPTAIDEASTIPEVDRILYALGEIVDAAIEVDGATLYGTVYVPDVPGGTKVPVLLDMGPYYGNLNADTFVYDEERPPNDLYAHFLERGYAIALVSLRGTGASSGCFMIGGPQENADVAAVVEWLAAQEWSSGAVAMTGVSYDGTTPWEALVSGAAPSLKAIVPVEGISDHYRYSFFEGVPVGGGQTFNTYYTALVDVAYATPTGVPRWAPGQPSNVCPETVDVIAQPYTTYRDGVHGAFWDARDMSAMLNGTTAAVFVVHGFKDFNVKMDHAQTLWEKIPGPKRMLLGQWEHNIPWDNSYDPEMSWPQYNETILQFLDAYVKGDPAALAREQAAAPVLVQDSANTTWDLRAWPPAESTPVAWGLGADGALAPGAGGEGEARIRATPLLFAPLEVGPINDALPKLIQFETEPFAEDAFFFGNPWIELDVSVDRPEGMLAARLYKLEAGSPEQMSLGWQNLATRTSRDQGEDVPTGTPMRIRILMEGIAEKVDKGDKLALVITAENSNALVAYPHHVEYTIALGGEAALWLPTFTPPAPTTTSER